MTHNKSILLALICLLTTGCSVLSPIKTVPENIYNISALPTITPAVHSKKVNLQVALPTSDAMYNTRQIAYSIKPYTLAYYPHSTWAETPAEMFYPLLVQTLESAKLYRHIVNSASESTDQYMLTTHIEKLQFEIGTQPAMIDLKIRVQLSKSATHEVLATDYISIQEELPRVDLYQGIIAANTAMQKALTQILQFCAQATSKNNNNNS